MAPGGRFQSKKGPKMRKMGHFGPKKAQNEKIKNPFFSYPEWVLNPKFQVESLKNGRNRVSDRQTDKKLKEGKQLLFQSSYGVSINAL